VNAVLSIRDLSVRFPSANAEVEAVRNVSIEVGRGEITGLVGESGSGKTLTAMCAMGLQPANAQVSAKRIEVAGHDVTALDRMQLRSIRGRDIALVPQEPMNSLNPTLRIGKQLEIVIRTHKAMTRAEARASALHSLAQMSIDDPDRVLRAYPFELSGGMRQRVLLAMAFSCRPGILIADEPTTALDVTVQQQVLNLLQAGARANDTSVLFITHDLGVVWNLCHRVYVMRRGEIVEHGAARTVIEAPQHPYTQRLLAALPDNSPPRTPLPVGMDELEPGPHRPA